MNARKEGMDDMNKSELVAAVAERAELKRKDAAAAIDAVVDVISEKLGQGEEVSIIGFGTFSVKSRAERVGRNPRTGESITIAAAKTPVFKPGKALKDAV
ncbi:MAG TPA: HU family DNA-binding protein [Armatimonadetes bacterium]|jgi:DNA-binding protein HU-beta|nr:HU family DNA-binding protein [Armatimonadota bacterium]